MARLGRQDTDVGRGFRFNPAFVSYEYDSPPVVVRNCTLTRCRIWKAYLRYVLLEDSIVDGLSGSQFMTREVLLKHVVIRGPVDSIDIRHPRQVMGPEPLIALHAAHYETVDWALDISEARFARCDIGGVPGRLVRRDPATQVLVTRERVLAAPWREVAQGEWKIGIERLLKAEADSEVFVACLRGGRFEETLAVFQRLREAGIAEPD
jgi:pentatricopeptide repeat protein